MTTRDYSTSRGVCPETLTSMFIVEREDEALYTTQVWAFPTREMAEQHIAEWAKTHPCDSEFDEYEMAIYEVSLSDLKFVARI